MSLLKALVVMITAWIGTVWPGAWATLILLVSASVLCISLAFDRPEEDVTGPALEPATT